MDYFIRLIIVALRACAILSVLFYIFAVISLIKTKNGENKKKRGILFLVLGTILAYMPLEYILGISALRKGMLLLILIDCIMIYKFIKQ